MSLRYFFETFEIVQFSFISSDCDFHMLLIGCLSGLNSFATSTSRPLSNLIKAYTGAHFDGFFHVLLSSFDYILGIVIIEVEVLVDGQKISHGRYEVPIVYFFICLHEFEDVVEISEKVMNILLPLVVLNRFGNEVERAVRVLWQQVWRLFGDSAAVILFKLISKVLVLG